LCFLCICTVKLEGSFMGEKRGRVAWFEVGVVEDRSWRWRRSTNGLRWDGMGLREWSKEIIRIWGWG